VAGNELVARNVRRFREERQLSLSEVGRRAGLAKQTVASLEAGAGNPTVDTLERLANALGVSLRALLTEMGTDMLVQRSLGASWLDSGPLEIRHLGQVYGSGYVTTSVLRLEFDRGASHHKGGGRGSLRHCYVIEGRVKLGPQGSIVDAAAGDFVRFPAELPHLFQAVSTESLLFVVTTAPQLTMTAGDSLF
jgi:transcriptional regulator with XRE-family HTH domain